MYTKWDLKEVLVDFFCVGAVGVKLSKRKK